MDAPIQELWARIAQLQEDMERLRTIEVPGGAPGFIARTSGNGSLTTLPLTVPAGFKHLQIKGKSKLASGASAVVPIWMRFNADAGSNYTWESVYYAGAASVVQGDHGTARVAQMVCGNTTDLADADYAALDLDIIGASAVNLNRSIQYTGQFTFGSNHSTGWFGGSGQWNNSAVITAISIISSNGVAFATGSFFDLYGWV